MITQEPESLQAWVLSAVLTVTMPNCTKPTLMACKVAVAPVLACVSTSGVEHAPVRDE